MRKILALIGMFALGGLLAVAFAVTAAGLNCLQQIDAPPVFPLKFGDTSIAILPSDEIGDQVFFITEDALLTLTFDKQNKMQLNSIGMSNHGDLFVSYTIQFAGDLVHSVYLGKKNSYSDLNADGDFDMIRSFTESDSITSIYYNSEWILADKTDRKTSYRFDVEKGWVKK